MNVPNILHEKRPTCNTAHKSKVMIMREKLSIIKFLHWYLLSNKINRFV